MRAYCARFIVVRRKTSRARRGSAFVRVARATGERRRGIEWNRGFENRLLDRALSIRFLSFSFSRIFSERIENTRRRGNLTRSTEITKERKHSGDDCWLLERILF